MGNIYAIASELTGADIKKVRNLLEMTQREFAAFANCVVRTVENWETKDGAITGPIVTLVVAKFLLNVYNM